jgi:hypothetical protein
VGVPPAGGPVRVAPASRARRVAATTASPPPTNVSSGALRDLSAVNSAVWSPIDVDGTLDTGATADLIADYRPALTRVRLVLVDGVE